MEKKVSVIIPTYNTEEYIKCCVESVLNQTYKNYEIIVVNDGSTDNTLKVLEEIKTDKLKVITIKNSGQGYARNMALKEATGEYIFFLDSDDYVEPVTLEVSVKRIEQDNSDLVCFDYKYFKVKENLMTYTSKEEFFNKKMLIGDECLETLKIPHYFTVNKLYRKSFLLENKCKYGEGYIYEDVEFWVKVATRAKKISLIHSPLYIIRTNIESTTRSNHNTDRHVNGFIKAFDNSIKSIKNNKAKYIFLNYMMQKFLIYYSKRTPNKLKKHFSQEVYSRFKSYKLDNLDKTDKLIKLGIKLDALKSISRFRFYANIACKLKTKYRDTRKTLRNIKNYLLDKNEIYLRKYNNKKQNNILFMGFDYRYTGNSRYLFEDLIKTKQDNVYFVTNDILVDEKYRIIPKSKKMYSILSTAKVVVFESWISKKFNKNRDAIWIQLWHGTPLKKMLFDSEETEIITKNLNHKINKYNDINRWDFLLVDNPNIAKYFKTSFLIKNEKLMNHGYPRVKYLVENIQNNELKYKIKEKCNIDKNKKVVLYLPTWRDYNYGKKQEEQDFEYFLNTETLTEKLGSDYIIISKNHIFLNSKSSDSITNVDIETQELLLIADYLITDYSSVLFDAFAIDLPTVLLANDYDKYSKSRGVYKEIWDDLASFIVNNEIDLAKKIKSYKINKEYLKVKEKYAYKNVEENNLKDFIINLSKGEK